MRFFTSHVIIEQILIQSEQEREKIESIILNAIHKQREKK